MRDAYAVVSLGPSDACRYVVDCNVPTWRMTPAGGDRLELGGWAAYDVNHREVRRESGRMLAGWDAFGQLRRENLVTGEAQPLGPAQREVTAAVAIPGTPNVMLLALDDAEAWLRVV